jgi:hypothetical protein
MARNIEKTRSTSLLNKDFDSFKKDAIRFMDAYASGSIVDKSTPSSAMVLIELMAFIGDTLAFGIDQSFNELREDTSSQVENVVEFARMRGYKVKGKTPARGKLPIMIEVPAAVVSGSVVPDPLYLPTLPKGAQAQSKNGVLFETLEEIDYSNSTGRDVTGSLFNSSGIPTYFAVRKSAEIISGQTKTESFSITDFKQFRTIELSDQDVTEIISVVDSDNNEWVEVEYLANDWVFSADSNETSDAEDVPYVLKVVAAPRRFISKWNPVTKKTTITFGSGDGISSDDELIPNVADYSIPLYGKRTISSVPIDPRNFLKTRTLGMSPFNTTLTVTYRSGGGKDGNVEPGSIDSMVKADLSFATTNLDSIKKGDIESSIQCFNTDRTDGGAEEETVKEIKANSAAFFSAQDRCVTRDDMIARVLSLPAKFGKPAKVFAKTSRQNDGSVDIYMLAKNSEGHFISPSNTLRNNVATYINKYRMLTDGFNIFNGNVINMRCRFGIVVSPSFNKSETISRCISALKKYFDSDLAQIGQPIVLSNVISTIDDVEGVVSVYELNMTNVFGTIDGLQYSSTRFDFESATKNGMIICPDNSLIELRYPRRDIVGVAK